MSAAAPKQMNPLLAAYLRNLSSNPLRTKAVTTGMSTHELSPFPAPCVLYFRYLRTRNRALAE